MYLIGGFLGRNIGRIVLFEEVGGGLFYFDPILPRGFDFLLFREQRCVTDLPQRGFDSPSAGTRSDGMNIFFSRLDSCRLRDRKNLLVCCLIFSSLKAYESIASHGEKLKSS